MVLGVGDAFSLELPADPGCGFVFRVQVLTGPNNGVDTAKMLPHSLPLQEAKVDRAVLGVVEAKTNVEGKSLVKVSWKVVALQIGVSNFSVEFGIPWEGMQPLVDIEVSVVDSKPLDNRKQEAASMMSAAVQSQSPAGVSCTEYTQSGHDAPASGRCEDHETAEAASALSAALSAAIELRDAAAEVKAANVEMLDLGRARGSSAEDTSLSSAAEAGLPARAPEPAVVRAIAVEALPPPVQSWSVVQLGAWLTTEMKLADVAKAAIAEEVDGVTALEMVREDWIDLGASGIKASKIIGTLKKLIAVPNGA